MECGWLTESSSDPFSSAFSSQAIAGLACRWVLIIRARRDSIYEGGRTSVKVYMLQFSHNLCLRVWYVLSRY